MKKLFVMMMCLMAVAFTSCKPDPVPEPANAKFIGSYEGTVTLNGEITAPAFPDQNMPIGETQPWSAVITAGSTDEKVHVVFTMNEENYETDGTVSENSVDFGMLTYHYKEQLTGSDVTIRMTPTSVLEGSVINLSGPIEGDGVAAIAPGIPPIEIHASGTFTGTLTKAASN